MADLGGERHDCPGVVAFAATRAQTGTMLAAGQPAPDFSVADESGNVHRLADYAGKTLVLWFYPKADTPG